MLNDGSCGTKKKLKKTQNQTRQGSLLKVVKVDGFEFFFLEALFSFKK